MTFLTMSPYGPAHTPTVIVVVLPFVVFRLSDADALLPEPHAATEISVAAASTAAAIRLMPLFLAMVMVMVSPLLLVCEKFVSQQLAATCRSLRLMIDRLFACFGVCLSLFHDVWIVDGEGLFGEMHFAG